MIKENRKSDVYELARLHASEKYEHLTLCVKCMLVLFRHIVTLSFKLTCCSLYLFNVVHQITKPELIQVHVSLLVVLWLFIY